MPNVCFYRTATTFSSLCDMDLDAGSIVFNTGTTGRSPRGIAVVGEDGSPTLYATFTTINLNTSCTTNSAKLGTVISAGEPSTIYQVPEPIEPLDYIPGGSVKLAPILYVSESESSDTPVDTKYFDNRIVITKDPSGSVSYAISSTCDDDDSVEEFGENSYITHRCSATTSDVSAHWHTRTCGSATSYADASIAVHSTTDDASTATEAYSLFNIGYEGFTRRMTADSSTTIVDGIQMGTRWIAASLSFSTSTTITGTLTVPGIVFSATGMSLSTSSLSIYNIVNSYKTLATDGSFSYVTPTEITTATFSSTRNRRASNGVIATKLSYTLRRNSTVAGTAAIALCLRGIFEHI